MYADQDGALKEALQKMDGDPTSVEMFGKFYDEVKEMKARNEKSVRQATSTEHEAKWMRGPEGRNHSLRDCLAAFSPVESLGRFLDISSIHLQYNDLPGISNSEQRRLDYSSFLTSLVQLPYFAVPSHPTRTSPQYSTLLQDFIAYLKSFISRSKPLLDLSILEKTAQDDFSTAWEAHTYEPYIEEEDRTANGTSMDVDGAQPSSPSSAAGWLLPWQLDHLRASSATAVTTLYCACCNTTMAKDTVWRSHIGSKKHNKSLQAYETLVKDVSRYEELLKALLDAVSEPLEATKDDLEKKLARAPGEAGFMGRSEADMDDDDFDADDSDDEGSLKARRRMTKKNYPVGPDGAPIPFWLYRLQGHSQEFKCQICGNASYFGRRAFEKHFHSDPRHAYGLKCLGIDLTREFYEITDIEKALGLHKHLIEQKKQGKWDANTMEEFEDDDGTVLDKATHDLLAKQMGGY